MRPAAVAGAFYPAEPERLRAMVDALLEGAAPGGPAPKALVAPHAGYVYSGPVAASAYAQLAAARGRVRRVVLLGPSHYVSFRGLALPGTEALATPLGDLPVDDGGAALAALPQVSILPAAHAREHSLEVHLPFLLRALGGAAVVPLAVGRAAPAEVAEALEVLWGGEETVVVVSSDLSHYLPYEEAREVDLRTAERIAALDPEPLPPDAACGAHPLNGLVYAARWRRMRARLLDLRNSGDTAGPRDRVVGYGAFAFHEPEGRDAPRSAEGP